MQFNFSIPRLVLLLALLATFAMAGGFSPPLLAETSIYDPSRIDRAWLYCVIMFVAGAVGASVVDHFVGTVDRTNIRLVYFVVGASLMLGSYLWLRGLHAMAG